MSLRSHKKKKAHPTGTNVRGISSGILIQNPSKILEVWSGYVNNPVAFAHDMLRVELHDYQCEILESVAKNDRVAWHASHGAGKDFLISCIVPWFLFTRPLSKVITTAPTWRQVVKMTWSEINARLRGAALPAMYEALTTAIRISRDWFATGESCSDPRKLEGFHAPTGIMYCVSEAKTVTDETFEAIQGALTAQESKEINFSTPGSRFGKFFERCSKQAKTPANPKGNWDVHHTMAYGCPAVNQRWIEEMAQEWGETSSIFVARVRGEFPYEDEGTIIPLSWAEAAVERDWTEQRNRIVGVGVDVAREGENETVIAVCKGYRLDYLKPHKYAKIPVTVEKVKEVLDSEQYKRYDFCQIDDAGVGGGVTDYLMAAGYNVTPVNACNTAANPGFFANLGSELWWNARKIFENNLASIPDEPTLIHQLTSRKYSPEGGKIKIESKDEWKARKLKDSHGRQMKSPDRADAYVMAASLRGASFNMRPSIDLL